MTKSFFALYLTINLLLLCITISKKNVLFAADFDNMIDLDLIDNYELYKNQTTLEEEYLEYGINVNTADTLFLKEILGFSSQELKMIANLKKNNYWIKLEDLQAMGVLNRLTKKQKETLVFTKTNKQFISLQYANKYNLSNPYYTINTVLNNENIYLRFLGKYQESIKNIPYQSAFSLNYENHKDYSNPVKRLVLGSFQLYSGLGLVFGQKNNHNTLKNKNFTEIYNYPNLTGDYKLNGFLIHTKMKNLSLISFYSDQNTCLKLDSLNHIVSLPNLSDYSAYDKGKIISLGQIGEFKYHKIIFGVSYCQKKYPFSFVDLTKTKESHTYSNYLKLDLNPIFIAYELAQNNKKNSFCFALNYEHNAYQQKSTLELNHKAFPKNYRENAYSELNNYSLTNYFQYRIKNTLVCIALKQYKKKNDIQLFHGYDKQFNINYATETYEITINHSFLKSEDFITDELINKKRNKTKLSFDFNYYKKNALYTDLIYFTDFYPETHKTNNGFIFSQTYQLLLNKDQFFVKQGIYNSKKSEWITDETISENSYMRNVYGYGKFICLTYKQKINNHFLFVYYLNYQKDNNKNLSFYLKLICLINEKSN